MYKMKRTDGVHIIRETLGASCIFFEDMEHSFSRAQLSLARLQTSDPVLEVHNLSIALIRSIHHIPISC